MIDWHRVVEGARACIGTPFRPQGRLAGVGLDCIGLAMVAVRHGGIGVKAPADYDLSGNHMSRLADALDALGFARVQPADKKPGDILLFAPGHNQRHLGICTGEGFVHAHLGLRRVVETPLPSPWPLIGAWRVTSKG